MIVGNTPVNSGLTTKGGGYDLGERIFKIDWHGAVFMVWATMACYS